MGAGEIGLQPQTAPAPVMADLTRILADAAISIDAVMQKEPGEGETRTDIIMLTKRAPGSRAQRLASASPPASRPPARKRFRA